MSELSLSGEGTTDINLSFRSLSNLPDKLWDAQHLTKLVLAGNPITSISPHISKLTNLQYLNSGSCDLTSLPNTAIPHLLSLTYLNVSGNRISDIPESIGKLTGLTELLIGNNLFTHLPGSIGDLENLTVSFSLGKCKLEEIPAPIARLKQLKELQLSENNITGAIPSFIYRLPNLETLELKNNQIDSILGEDLHSCTGLELDEFFSTMSKLRVLAMDDNILTTIPPHTIANFASLSVLTISFNKITTLPADLARLTNLVMIDIASNNVTQLHSEWGVEMINLSAMDISYNDLTSIPDTFTSLESLRVFTILGNNIQEMPAICQVLIDRGVRVRFNDAASLPNCIVNGLYLGGVSAARDKYSMKRLGIKRILTVAEINPLHPGEFVYKCVRVDDHADQDLYSFFEECRQFINEGIQDGGILVHWYA